MFATTRSKSRRRLADEVRRRLGVADPGQLEEGILVAALLADLGLADAERDPRPLDLDRAVYVVFGDVVLLRRHRAKDDLEAALEVETELGRLVEGRRRERDREDAEERGERPQ